MFSSVKKWVIGGTVAVGTAVGGYLGLAEPPLGTDEWFRYKTDQVTNLSGQISSIKRMMNDVNDFNVLESYKFTLKSARQECSYVVEYHNEEARKHKKPELSMRLCE
jgi:hypothetical protein